MKLEEKISNFKYEIILGSASPRRQELLKSLGFSFKCKPMNAEENWPSGLEAQDIPVFLSRLKAESYASLSESELLITADTVVWCAGKVYNKPSGFDEGKQMLSELSGRMHEVFTAVTLTTTKKQISFYDTSKVYFKDLTEDEIYYYLTNYKPYDKAGGYGVQEWIGYIAIDKIEGSFYNVMGLPVQKLYEQLLNF